MICCAAGERPQSSNKGPQRSAGGRERGDNRRERGDRDDRPPRGPRSGRPRLSSKEKVESSNCIRWLGLVVGILRKLV